MWTTITFSFMWFLPEWSVSVFPIPFLLIEQMNISRKSIFSFNNRLVCFSNLFHAYAIFCKFDKSCFFWKIDIPFQEITSNDNSHILFSFFIIFKKNFFWGGGLLILAHELNLFNALLLFTFGDCWHSRI